MALYSQISTGTNNGIILLQPVYVYYLTNGALFSSVSPEWGARMGSEPASEGGSSPVKTCVPLGSMARSFLEQGFLR